MTKETDELMTYTTDVRLSCGHMVMHIRLTREGVPVSLATCKLGEDKGQVFDIVRQQATPSGGALDAMAAPERLVLHCPTCNLQHIDRGEWATIKHTTHLCEGCGAKWKPAPHFTVGVDALPTTGDEHA